MSSKRRIEPLDVQDPLHPIAIGAIVTVLRRTAMSAVVEGHAVVKAIAPGHHRYRVRFTGDPVLKERAVYRAVDHEAASDPQQKTETRLESRCVDTELSPIVSDFFPEHTNT